MYFKKGLIEYILKEKYTYDMIFSNKNAKIKVNYHISNM